MSRDKQKRKENKQIILYFLGLGQVSALGTVTMYYYGKQSPVPFQWLKKSDNRNHAVLINEV